MHLDRQWQLNYTDYGQGERLGFHTVKNTDDWLLARVPGDVHLDLMSAGIIPDPFYGLQSDHCIWMEEKDWWYRTNFFCTQSERENHFLYLMFHGLDTFATIYLNGQRVATHANMFRPLRVDITALVEDGENDLRICLASPAYAPELDIDPPVAGWPPQRLRTRKAQACYGWDISPRLVTIGIWRPVELLICDELELVDAWVWTKQLDKSECELILEFTVGHNSSGRSRPTIDMKVAGQKRSIELEVDAPATRKVETFVLPHPPLWWPHNHGEPNLLEYSVQIVDDEGVADLFDGRFGVRTVELVQESQDAGKTSFYFKINNKPIFLKGMNWTPADAIYARVSDARYRMLLEKAADTGINALRVWGGGIYESKFFYNLCDELGLLVWQDFMFSCGVYPQDEAFLQEVHAEAEHVVTNLRAHPSIFVWCGDNENDRDAYRLGNTEYWHNLNNRDVLPRVCRDLDPSRAYVPSSPFSPDQGDPDSPNQGDVHLWAHGTAYQGDFFSKCRPRMVTEIGHLSVPDMEVLKSAMPAEWLWPPHNPYWYMHCSDPLRRGESYRVESLFHSIQNKGLSEPNDLDELIRVTQGLQADATNFWIDHFSSDPECWGIFLWNWCDCWPQISDAYIAYPFSEKPAIESVKEAFGRINR